MKSGEAGITNSGTRPARSGRTGSRKQTPRLLEPFHWLSFMPSVSMSNVATEIGLQCVAILNLLCDINHVLIGRPHKAKLPCRRTESFHSRTTLLLYSVTELRMNSPMKNSYQDSHIGDQVLMPAGSHLSPDVGGSSVTQPSEPQLPLANQAWSQPRAHPLRRMRNPGYQVL